MTKKKTRSKYTVFDKILGSSASLTRGTLLGRHNQYIKSTIHTVDELVRCLKDQISNGQLIYNIQATIPYKFIDLPPTPSKDELTNKCKDIIKIIEGITSQQFFYRSSRISKPTKILSSMLFRCTQDKNTQMPKPKRLSNRKCFDCKSSIFFRFRAGYGFITIDMNHSSHHKTLDIVHTPEDLEDFIKLRMCETSDDMYLVVKDSGKFTDYINQKSSKPKRKIHRLWMKYNTGVWQHDKDGKSTDKFFPRTGETENETVNSRNLESLNEEDRNDEEDFHTLESMEYHNDDCPNGRTYEEPEGTSDSQIEKIDELISLLTVLRNHKGEYDAFMSCDENRLSIERCLERVKEIDTIVELHKQAMMEGNTNNSPLPHDHVSFQQYNGNILPNSRQW